MKNIYFSKRFLFSLRKTKLKLMGKVGLMKNEIDFIFLLSCVFGKLIKMYLKLFDEFSNFIFDCNKIFCNILFQTFNGRDNISLLEVVLSGTRSLKLEKCLTELFSSTFSCRVFTWYRKAYRDVPHAHTECGR